MREQYEGLTAVREQVKLARSLIKRIDDKDRRTALALVLEQAEVPFRRAIDAGHQCVYEDLRTSLAAAQDRIQAVLTTLANR